MLTKIFRLSGSVARPVVRICPDAMRFSGDRSEAGKIFEPFAVQP
jgi:hypothetical protein